MDNSPFIALLNPAIALVLASAFLALWMYQRHLVYLAVLAAAFAGSATGFLFQYFTLPFGFVATKMISGLAFSIAACCLSGAAVVRYGRRVPYRGIGIFAVGGYAAYAWFMLVQPDLTWRILALNFAFGGISLVAAAELRAVRANGPIEMVLFALALMSGVNFIVRPLLIIAMHGPFLGYVGLYNSVYWTTALLSHALLSLLIALCLFTAAALDILKALKTETHTDPLSGLLNRRGFEERAGHMLEQCSRTRFPVALVLADLDHFKAINDRFGHAAGDRVIADFASKLLTAAGARGVAGRVGGEEFAVLLPLTDLASARLFAEAVRTVFGSGAVDGLPLGTRVTASFGVAARTGDEGLEPLMRRADDALYKAKRNGRDSVRLSYERPEVPFLADVLTVG